MINLLYQTWINNVPISNSVPPHKRKMSGTGYGNVKSNYLEIGLLIYKQYVNKRDY